MRCIADTSSGPDRLWITGVAGFIGRAVLMEARRQPRQLHISGIGRGLESSNSLFRTALDVALPGTISPITLNRLAASSGPPTHVIHLAAGASVGQSFDGPGQDFQKTVDGSACLFHWLGRHAPHARVVLASSAAVYGAGLEGSRARSPRTAPVNRPLLMDGTRKSLKTSDNVKHRPVVLGFCPHAYSQPTDRDCESSYSGTSPKRSSRTPRQFA
jgi:nucleoside-diphosphate-sugar epimerase